MGGWWISDLMNSPDINGQVWVVSWIAWVIVSICLHELAHGWTAIKLGDQTPRLAGHMTWNPLVHMGKWSFAMLAVLGIAWGAMPVDSTRLRGKYAETLVLAAGPAMNLLLAILSLALLVLWRALAGGQIMPSVVINDPLAENFAVFFALGARLNIVLMLFNLLPVMPLDGGRILADRWVWYRELMYSENGQWFSLIAFIFIFLTMGEKLFYVAELAVYKSAEFSWIHLFPNLAPWNWGYHSL